MILFKKIKKTYYSIILLQLIVTGYILISQDSNSVVFKSQEIKNLFYKEQDASYDDNSCGIAIDISKINNNNSKLDECIKDGWIYSNERGELTFNINHNMTCTYGTYEWYKNDNVCLLRKNSINLKNGSKLNQEKDFHFINCIVNKTTIYNASFARIFKPKKYIKKAQQPINIILVGFDSISREDFINYLPISSDYLINTMKSNLLTRYNIVGDGTPAALIPLLTSKHEHELPNTIKKTEKTNYLNDVYPMIWDNFSKLLNYSTLFSEDRPGIGVFNLRMNGFSRQPVDHYIRPLMLANLNRNQYCTNRKTNLKFYLDYVNDFMNVYKLNGFFGLSFIKEFSHDDYNRLSFIDTELYEFLSLFHQDKSLSNNTILILFSDHGPRFSDTRKSIKGLLRERNPFYSIYIPELFKSKYSNEYNTFLNNINKLITPMDIHKSLKHILQLEYNSNNASRKLDLINYDTRSISLFNTIISNNRTCQSAGIDMHWCSCLKRTEINYNSLKNEKLKKSLLYMVNYFINYLNTKILINHTSMCHELRFEKIIKIYQLETYISNITNQNTHRVKWPIKNKPLDFKSNLEYGYKKYFFQIVTKPNMGEYEFTINSEFDYKNEYLLKNITLNEKLISRINKYGDQPNCIIDTYPDLRKYCYCK